MIRSVEWLPAIERMACAGLFAGQARSYRLRADGNPVGAGLPREKAGTGRR
ncbi:hypothetical protein J2W83_005034 [Pseudomonas hunanensis]|uniref:Uncharacterized protein n=1 Tax=Pseudomonas hunanensis TaxID=1247546 RepID=A0ACC6KAG7_9PSED|nr:hypothetical protein [Pseudomonas hunanensis]